MKKLTKLKFLATPYWLMLLACGVLVVLGASQTTGGGYSLTSNTASSSSSSSPSSAQTSGSGTTAGGCSYDQFFGLLPWYNYLPCKPDPITGQEEPIVSFTNTTLNNGNGSCGSSSNSAGASTGCGLRAGVSTGQCQSSGTDCGAGLGTVWLIALAVLEDLLRIAGMAAVFMVIYGGIRYTVSNGDPQDTTAARSAIINALIGLIIAIIASATVAFLGKTLGG